MTLVWVQRCIRIVLGGLFVYASWDKIQNPFGFADVVAQYHLLPDALITPFSFVLPWLELITGVCLILGVFVLPASLLVAVMCFMFIVALS